MTTWSGDDAKKELPLLRIPITLRPITPRLPRLLWLWPGLRSLWLSGSWTSLAIAVVSAWMLCGLLAVTLVWTEVTTVVMRGGGWMGVVTIWIVSAFWSRRAERKSERLAASGDGLPQGRDLFSEAMSEYLKGDYLEAERQLRPLIAGNPNDAEARLLLATLLRRVGRMDEACGQLRQLVKMDTAADWSREIQRELAIAEQAIRQQATKEQQTATDKVDDSIKNNKDASADMTKVA